MDYEEHFKNDWIPWNLNGTYEVVKKSLQDDPELIALKYAKLCGCNYIYKDECEALSASDIKPYKVSDKNSGLGYWCAKNGKVHVFLQIDIPWINWMDSEPVNIDEILEKYEN